MPTIDHISDTLKKLNISLPTPTAPLANYAAAKISDDGTLSISGQIPLKSDGTILTGTLGTTLNTDDGYQAARLCAINVIAQVSLALEGQLERVKECLKLSIFIASSPNYSQHSKVGNGASDLIVDVFGEIGKHTRSAVGVSSLPFSACVEVEALFKVSLDTHQ